MKKKLFKLVVFVPALACLCLMSSKPVGAPYSTSITPTDEIKGIVVEKPEYDFGTIKEADGPVTAVFKVINGTNEAIILTKVQASCGCTTPSYTKEPIEPGKTGEITATYNPSGRPGNFDKTITATTSTNEKLTMRIKGVVL